jgi:hypothetical protein
MDFDPVRYEQVVSQTDYEGTFDAGSELPVRAFRTVELRRIVWEDEERDIRMEMTVPREEILLVEAAMN